MGLETLAFTGCRSWYLSRLIWAHRSLDDGTVDFISFTTMNIEIFCFLSHFAICMCAFFFLWLSSFWEAFMHCLRESANTFAKLCFIYMGPPPYYEPILYYFEKKKKKLNWLFLFPICSWLTRSGWYVSATFFFEWIRRVVNMFLIWRKTMAGGKKGGKKKLVKTGCM